MPAFFQNKLREIKGDCVYYVLTCYGPSARCGKVSVGQTKKKTEEGREEAN
jgi:hypothetical protein